MNLLETDIEYRKIITNRENEQAYHVFLEEKKIYQNFDRKNLVPSKPFLL